MILLMMVMMLLQSPICISHSNLTNDDDNDNNDNVDDHGDDGDGLAISNLQFVFSLPNVSSSFSLCVTFLQMKPILL